MRKLLGIVLGSVLPARAGWSLADASGVTVGYWLAAVGFALGWDFSQ